MSKLRVHRKGYHRKGFIAHRGRKKYRVKPTYVPPTTYTVKDRGKKGRGKKILPKLRRGDLKKYGYSLSETPRARHLALSKAIRAYGYRSVLGKLQALHVLFKRTEPSFSRKALRDMHWVVTHLGRRR